MKKPKNKISFYNKQNKMINLKKQKKPKLKKSIKKKYKK